MRIRALAIAATLVAGLAGCGNGDPAVPTLQEGQETTTTVAADGPDLSAATFTDLTGEADAAVGARDNVFLPQYIEVKAGTEVTFSNDGQQQHNVTPAVAGSFEAIDTAAFAPGASGAITFDTPGDYAYYCTLHGTKTKGMTGAVRVLE